MVKAVHTQHHQQNKKKKEQQQKIKKKKKKKKKETRFFSNPSLFTFLLPPALFGEESDIIARLRGSEGLLQAKSG